MCSFFWARIEFHNHLSLNEIAPNWPSNPRTQRKKLIHGNDPQKHQKSYTRIIWIFGHIFTTQSLKIMSFDDFWCRSTLKWLNFIKISFGEFSSISMVLYSRSNSFFVWTFFNPPFMSLFHEILTKKVNWKTKIKIGP